MEKVNIELLKIRLRIEKDEKRRKEIEDILEKDDEELADLYMKKHYKTIKEKQEIIANALKIKVDDVIYDKSEKFISGNRNKFEIHHKAIGYFDFYSLNEYEIDFYSCDINLVISKGSSIYAENINFKSLYFINCKININVIDDFCCENIHFLNCNICALNFNKVIIKGNMKFSNSIFINKSIFNSCIFQDNIYFNNSHFKDYTDFHECKFEKIACFYGATFEKTPNFSACYFKEPKAINLINIDIDKLDFKSVEQYIKDNYQDESYKNEIKNISSLKKDKIDNKHQLRYAKNLKDSFRTIKDILITQNSILEAQEWHKLELYAKEKELELEVESCYKEKKKPFIAAKSEDKNSINLTFNVLLLWIYRVTSLHHTNLPRIINFTSLNIVVFGGLIYLITYLSYLIDKQSNFWFFGVAFLSISVWVIVHLTVFKKQKIKNIRLISFTFLLFLITMILIESATLLMPFNNVIFALFLYCIFIIISFYFYSYINTKPLIFYSLNYIVYLLLIIAIVVKPQLINPFVGIFSSDKLYESKFEKRLNDLNTSAIINLAKLSQKDFNFTKEYINISFTELNSAKALIVANKEKLKEILSKVYDDKYESGYKKVLNELENNTSNVKNIIEKIDNKNNNSVVSTQLNQFLKLNFTQEVDFLHGIKRNFSISEKLSPEQMALFDQKDSQDKLKNILSLLNFKVSFEEILKIIKQDENMQGVIKSTSILYSIILLLCIFSLQKTARKNSIVPS